MLRINLLPAYVAQRRLNKQLIAIYTVVFIAVVVGMLGYQFGILVPADVNESNLANQAVQAQQYIASETNLASTTAGAVAPIQANIDFVHGVETYNTNYPSLYETVAKFTSPRILYYGMQVSGSTLTINAYTPSIEALGRYLQIMYHEPDFTTVSISAIPTPAQAAEKIYYYKGVEIGRSGTATSTASSSSTSGSLPGVPTGVPVTLPGSLKTTGQQKQSPVAQMRQPQNSMFGFGSTTGGQQNVFQEIDADPMFNSKYFKVVPRRTDGFIFTVTCGLKTTFSPPAVPSGAVAAAVGRGVPGGPLSGG